MRTNINKEYLKKVELLAEKFADQRAKEFMPDSYVKVFRSTYEVYYSMCIYLYIRLYKISTNPNDFNFNRIHSHTLKKFSCKLYHKIVLDLEKNNILRVNNHYNWVPKRNGVEQLTFTKSFMLTSDVMRMMNQSKAKLKKDISITVPEKTETFFSDVKKTEIETKEISNTKLNRNLKETKEKIDSVSNFYAELTYDYKDLQAYCKNDEILEHYYIENLKRLSLSPRFIKGRWYHLFHNLKKDFRENVLRLDGKHIKEVYDISGSDLHMLAKVLESNETIPVRELKRFQKDVMADFRKKFGVKKNGKCKALVKRAFKIYLNSNEQFYRLINGKSICKKIDDYFRMHYPNIREYIVHKDAIWLDLMSAEFEYVSDRLVKSLRKDYGIKALSCHDSIWLKEDEKAPDIKLLFYDILGLAAYNELKLENL